MLRYIVRIHRFRVTMSFLLLIMLTIAMLVPVGVYLTIRYPGVVMISAFALTPFQTALFGEGAEVRMGVVDLLAIAMCLPLVVRLISRRSLRMGRVGGCILLFLATATLSSTITGLSAEAEVSLIRMLTNTLLPVLLYANLDRRLLTYHRCYAAYLLAINLLSACVIAAFAKGGFRGSIETLGMNKNFTGPVLGCGIGITLVYILTEGIGSRRGIWLIATLATALVAMVLTLSRGAWIATAAGTLIAICTTRNIRLVIFGAIVGVLACGLSWRLLPDTATHYASDVSAGSETIKLRLEYIDYVVSLFKAHPIFGVGVGLRKMIEPHNVLILTAGETGVVGLVTFSVMFLAGFWTTVSAWRRCKKMLPAQQLAAMATVVLCVTLVDGLMDVYWRRGIGLMGWAGVGISLLIGRSVPVALSQSRRTVHRGTVFAEQTA